MKAIFSLRKHSYLKIIGTFIIAIALIAGIVGCDGTPAEYALTMAVNPAEGGTATDLTGDSPYARATVVNITAVADDCHRFVDWSATAGTLADPNAATTTFTMPAEDVTVTANFELVPPDHIKFYDVYEGAVPDIGYVSLTDQFVEDLVVEVGPAVLFGNPVEKNHPGMPLSPIADNNLHYTYYELSYDMDAYSVRRSVEISNQFQDKEEMTVWGPVALAVPTQKLVPGDHEMPVCANHFLVYQVDYLEWEEFDLVEGVNLKDQFIQEGEVVEVVNPVLFANPVEKTIVEGGKVTEIEDLTEHWVLYDISEAQPTSIEKTIEINNQFGLQTLDLTYRELLAVPTVKNVPPTGPLEHFKCYTAIGSSLQGLDVWLIDQFHEEYFVGLVNEPILFCNPVVKVYGSVTTSMNPDNHLTVYNISSSTDEWTVTVDNQFGDDQSLLVEGPVALAVPTQKVLPGDHGLPKYLDHYLLYEVVGGPDVDVTVDLDDEFPPDPSEVKVDVTTPKYFAIPAIKGYLDYEPGLWDTKEHLLFYVISDNGEYYQQVWINNQFFQLDPTPLDLLHMPQYLAVPSVKVDWAPYEPS